MEARSRRADSRWLMREEGRFSYSRLDPDWQKDTQRECNKGISQSHSAQAQDQDSSLQPLGSSQPHKCLNVASRQLPTPPNLLLALGSEDATQSYQLFGIGPQSPREEK